MGRAARRAGYSERADVAREGVKGAVVVRQYNGRMLKLVETSDAQVHVLTGEQLLRQVADLIVDRLPEVPLADVDRGRLVALRLAAQP